MRNINLTISYDGTNFCGWQRQDDKNGNEANRTVQGEIEKALEKLHKQKIILYGSGRTDSGVHAVGQAANFFSPLESIKTENYVRALNTFLPPDVRILNAQEVSEDFNARFSATSRVYRYFISTQNGVPANMNQYVWNIPLYEPNLDRLNSYCEFLKGEMDCAAFASSGDDSVSTFRYIDDAQFFYQNDIWGNKMLVFQIEANAFLWKMVRTLTGTLVNLDKKQLPPDFMKQIIDSKDRKNAGVTAPPHGLFLYKIKFDGTRRHV